MSFPSFFHALRSWWHGQMQASPSIQALVSRYHGLREREQRLVQVACTLLGLLFLWLVLLQPLVSFLNSINNQHEQALADQRLATEAFELLQQARSAEWQVITESNIEPFLATKMTAYGIPGRTQKQGDFWQISWAQVNTLPSILGFVDYLSDSGLIIRELKAQNGNVILSVQTQ